MSEEQLETQQRHEWQTLFGSTIGFHLYTYEQRVDFMQAEKDRIVQRAMARAQATRSIERPFDYGAAATHEAQGAGLSMLKRYGFKPTTAAERKARQERKEKERASQEPAEYGPPVSRVRQMKLVK